ncbi:MAG: hypothetical protein GY906_09255 [bacterium]|nr:hypothetical protein [bacterium]
MKIRTALCGLCFLVIALVSVTTEVEARSGRSKDEKGHLRIVHAHALPSLDPHLDLTFITTSVLGNLFEALVEFDSEGKPAPRLAQRWENPDELTWKFTLRRLVRFHDGRDMTAEDVVASLHRAKTHPQSKMSTYLASVESVEAVGRSTIVLRTKTPSPALLSKLAFVVIQPADTPENLVLPIGTGPYRISGYKPGESLRAVRFGKYWGAFPSEKEVEFLFVPDPSARVELLIDRAAALVEEVSPQDITRIEEKDDLWVESHLGNFVFYLALDPTRAPLDNPVVREAIDVSLDRQAIADGVFTGHALPANQIPGPGTFGFSKQLKQPTHNPERARELLRTLTHEGSPELILHYSTNRSLLAETIIRQLNAVGFAASGQAHSWPDLLELLDRKEAGFVLLGENNSSMDAGYFFDSVVHTTSTELSLGDFNFFNFSDREIDALIEQTGQEMDPAKRLKDFHDASSRLAEARGVLPLVVVMDLFGVRRDLVWRPRADGNCWAAEMSLSR